MLNPIKLIKILYFKYITWMYCRVGLEWGYHINDTFTYPPIKLSNKLSYLEREYEKYGYELVPRIVWVDSISYGIDYRSYLMVKSNNT